MPKYGGNDQGGGSRHLIDLKSQPLLLFAIKMATRPFWAEIKNLRTCYCAPYKLVSFSPTNMIVSDLERYDIGLPEYVKM